MEIVPCFIPISCSTTKCVPWCGVHEGSLKEITESVPPSAPRPAGLPQGCRKAPCLLISASAAGSHQVPGQVPQINASPDQCSGIQGVRSVWLLGLSPAPCCWSRHQTATFMWSRQSCLQNKATELLTKSPSCQIGLHRRDPHCAEALRSAPS